MNDNKNVTVKYNGLGTIGIVIAILLSWSKWHSIGWAIIHGILGWIYVAYYIIYYGLN